MNAHTPKTASGELMSCSECQGTGKVWSRGEWVDCWDCQGTGEVWVDDGETPGYAYGSRRSAGPSPRPLVSSGGAGTIKRGRPMMLGRRPTRRTRTAHQPGGEEALWHCPFCGSGRIVGRADGTTECRFCDRAFTVMTQPKTPNMPQTVEGQPYNNPDDAYQAAQVAEPPMGGLAGEGFTAAPGDITAPPDPKAPPGAKGDTADEDPAKPKPKGKVPPQFAALHTGMAGAPEGALYVGPGDTLMTEAQYVDFLASQVDG